jgi:hypothetical protein
VAKDSLGELCPLRAGRSDPRRGIPETRLVALRHSARSDHGRVRLFMVSSQSGTVSAVRGFLFRAAWSAWVNGDGLPPSEAMPALRDGHPALSIVPASNDHTPKGAQVWRGVMTILAQDVAGVSFALELW